MYVSDSVIIILAICIALILCGMYLKRSEKKKLLRNIRDLTPDETKRKISECEIALCNMLMVMQSTNEYGTIDYRDNFIKISKTLAIMDLLYSNPYPEIRKDSEYSKRVFNFLVSEEILTADRFWEMHSVVNIKKSLPTLEDLSITFSLASAYGDKYADMLNGYLKLNHEKQYNPYRVSYANDMYNKYSSNYEEYKTSQ